MTLRELLDRLGVSSQRLPGQASWQQHEDELFPSLEIHRLEERRLLNAAPVSVAPAPTPKDSGGEAHTSTHDASHDPAGNDIQNLARVTYGGPTLGNFSAEMVALTQHSSYSSGGHDAAQSDENGATESTTPRTQRAARVRRPQPPHRLRRSIRSLVSASPPINRPLTSCRVRRRRTKTRRT